MGRRELNERALTSAACRPTDFLTFLAENSSMRFRSLYAPVVCLVVVNCVGHLQAVEKSTTKVATTKSVVLTDGTLEGTALDDKQRVRLAKSGEAYADKGTFISKPVDLGSAGTTTVNWIEQWTAPQKWIKSDKNPILTPKQTGPWDGWTNGVAILRNPDEKSYKMFYAGQKGIGFAEAAIDDPLTWNEHPSSPVLKTNGNYWEGSKINQPRVVKVTDTHWRMYYTGWGEKVDYGVPWAMGLAESFDAGLTWKRHGDGEPIMERGPKGSYDDGAVFVPDVRRVGDKWMMWYCALKVIPGRQSIHLCAATSDDGIKWTKCDDANPVITHDFSVGHTRNVASRCHVRIDDGVFRMWYTHGNPDYKIRYAESLDGLHFERSPIHVVLDASKDKTAWDGKIVEYPTLDVVDGKWRLWFCGNGYGSVGYADGVVETGVKLYVRSGDKNEPDDSWSVWTPVTRGTPITVKRYMQVKADLWSENPVLSPALNMVEFVR